MPPFVPPLTAPEISAAFAGQYSTVVALTPGGQGAVFRADALGRTAASAVKIYFPDPMAQIEERTDREVAALGQIHVDTVVGLLGHGTVTIRGQVCRFVTTTYIDGAALADHIARQPLDLDGAARVAYDVAAAIDALWVRRIVHRDIKPSNVMLANSGGAVLIDLGVARHTSLASLTLTGNSWGTRGYMSPEQALGRKALTCKSDVFALGVLFQQCLAGRHPTGGNQQLLMNGGATIAALIPGLPRDVVALSNRMLQRDPTRRPLPNEIMQTLAPYARALGNAW
jgi:serine/threonine protein kinase